MTRMSCTHSIVVQKKSNPYSHAERIAGTRQGLVFFVFWEILHTGTDKKNKEAKLMSNEKKRNANKIIKNTERKLEGAEKYMDGDITAKGLSVAAGMAKTAEKTGHAFFDIHKALKASKKEDENMSRSENKAQKQFVKTDDAMRDVDTAQQQKGGERQERPRFIRKRQTENQKKEPERNKTDESRLERERAARQREVEQQRQRMKEEAQRNGRLHDGKEQAMVHDMTEQVLGQTYKVPGTNISYDDASIMAKNNIRDSAELTGISLEDDGFANSVEEVQEMMKGYIFNGVPDIDEVYDMTKDKGPDVIAQAYVNVLKETDVKSNIHTLTKIDEKFCFEHQAFEKQFDYIREHDSAADRVLDKVEMEMGRDRADG